MWKVLCCANFFPPLYSQVRDSYLKEMKELLEEQMNMAQRELGVPDDVR